MLVLSRKLGERILIGEDIEVTIVEIRGNQVKLGFSAPRCVSICRSEIHEKLAESLDGLPGSVSWCCPGESQ
jgi:carbon storage regulator